MPEARSAWESARRFHSPLKLLNNGAFPMWIESPFKSVILASASIGLAVCAIMAGMTLIDALL